MVFSQIVILKVIFQLSTLSVNIPYLFFNKNE